MAIHTNQHYDKRSTTSLGICNNVLYRIIITVLILLTPKISYAGAWTQDSGTFLFIQNISYYSNNEFFDDSGNNKASDTYSKYELNPYIEYGLRDDLTIGANLFLQKTSQNNSTNWGIADSEFFIRKRLWQKDNFVFSAEPIIKLPSIEIRSKQPRIGNKNFDAGLTFSSGYSFKAWGNDHFTNLDIGYRHRFGSPKDQLKLSATAGFSISKEYILLTQAFTTIRLANNNQSNFTQSSGDDYDLTKLQVSAIYKIDEKLSLQAGIFSHVAGRNVGGGSGATFAISKIF